jgi:hypothetical protein
LQGIGEPRPVQMYRKAKILSGGGDVFNFSQAIVRAALCGLGQGNRAALRSMHAAGLFRQN